MHKTNTPDTDLDSLLKQTLKDDLPPETEAGMKRKFLHIRHSADLSGRQTEANKRPWVFLQRRKGILTVASAAMMILGLVMQLSGSPNVLVRTIEQLKMMVTLSAALNRASSMDCTVLAQAGDDGQVSYHVRWRRDGDVRVDMNPADTGRTLWLSNGTASISGPGSYEVRSAPIGPMNPGPVWQPAMEFLSPETLIKNIEDRYGLGRIDINGAGPNEFLITGREGPQDVEILINAKTYLPRVLEKYSYNRSRANGTRSRTMKVQFLWNQPIAAGLFVPQASDQEP